MALFERVEVVRGANGLLTGTGNPAASINMIRKHATSREFKGEVSAEYGSWDKQRYVADMQSPLTDDGSVRARIIAGYQNNDSWLDRYNSEKTFFSGILDADLGTSTALSAGYEYQRIDVLDARMAEMGLNKEDYWWYRDLRRYGTVPHSGFGLGFERLIAYVTGVQNVRDVIPFPRTPRNATF